jgi:hypothetical protein
MSFGNLTSNCLGHTIPFDVLYVLECQNTISDILEEKFPGRWIAYGIPISGPHNPLISHPWTSSCHDM